MDNFLRQTAAARAATSTGGSEVQRPPIVSGFRTGRLLGVGSSACVWLVEHQDTGALRALKVPDASAPSAEAHGAEGSEGSEGLSELRREMAVLGTLEHPHLLGVHGIVSTDLGPAILLEHAGGGSLLNLVTARGRLSVGECITVLAPIAQALAYLHSASVQHGDVSPGNVLFSAEGKPLLADLGVGRLLGEANSRTHGTAGFSQTVLESGLPAGFASDVYSVAAIGWYSLTGRPPGPARERVPLPLLVPDVPVELLNILEAALHDDPEKRPTAAEVADAVLHSAPPQPLDLVAAVHPSVLPQLLTRRAPGDEVRVPRRRFFVDLTALPALKPRRRRAKRSPNASKDARRSARRRKGSRAGWVSVMLRVVPFLLVACGTLLVGPQLLDMIGSETNGAGQEAAAVEDSIGTGAQDNSEKSASQPEAPDTTSGTDQNMELSAEMRQRLADADPVKALSALVAVRAMVLATGEADLLSHVNVEDSAVMSTDREIAVGLQERGHVFHGLSIRLQETALTDALTIPKGAAAVAATAIMSGYTEMDASGAAVREVEESTPQDLVFVLVRQEEVWKIASVHNPGSS